MGRWDDVAKFRVFLGDRAISRDHIGDSTSTTCRFLLDFHWISAHRQTVHDLNKDILAITQVISLLPSISVPLVRHVLA